MIHRAGLEAIPGRLFPLAALRTVPPQESQFHASRAWSCLKERVGRAGRAFEPAECGMQSASKQRKSRAVNKTSNGAVMWQTV
jgi:hypothetical protein